MLQLEDANRLSRAVQAAALYDPDIAFDLGDAWFAAAIQAVHTRRKAPVLIGLCGPQGSGKSSTAARLRVRLAGLNLIAVVSSLDDFYLTRAERQALAVKVHPLLATRGVPGTHDVALMEGTIHALLTADAQSIVAIPTFDKAADDRLPTAAWQQHQGRADVVLVEGWCVGALPQDTAALEQPVNAFERDEDADGSWRTQVNITLARDYAPLFERLDLRLMLRAPSFDCIYRWRMEQEAGLDNSGSSAGPRMLPDEMHRFIAHYERLTRWLLQTEPANLIADLDVDRTPYRWRRKVDQHAQANFTVSQG